MTVATLIGSTGTVGSELVRLSSRAGTPTRAIYRRPTELPELAHVVWTKADLMQPELLEPALAGTHRLFLATDNRPGFGELQIRILHAAERLGVAHVVKLSAFGASRRADSPIAREHWQVEQALQHSSLSWTILRPHAFMQDWLDDVADSVRGERRIDSPIAAARVPFIDARDVAAVADVVLRSPAAHAGRKLYLSGGAAVSLHDLAAVLSAELGTVVSCREISLEEARARWLARGRHPGVVEGLLVFAAHQRAGGSTAEPSDVVGSLLGRPPRSLRDFVHDHAGHFR